MSNKNIIDISIQKPTEYEISLLSGPQGAPGARGPSGVYIGDTEPPVNPDINVWVKPGGTPTNISGRGTDLNITQIGITNSNEVPSVSEITEETRVSHSENKTIKNYKITIPRTKMTMQANVESLSAGEPASCEIAEPDESNTGFDYTLNFKIPEGRPAPIELDFNLNNKIPSDMLDSDDTLSKKQLNKGSGFTPKFKMIEREDGSMEETNVIESYVLTLPIVIGPQGDQGEVGPCPNLLFSINEANVDDAQSDKEVTKQTNVVGIRSGNDYEVNIELPYQYFYNQIKQSIKDIIDEAVGEAVDNALEKMGNYEFQVSETIPEDLISKERDVITFVYSQEEGGSGS